MLKVSKFIFKGLIIAFCCSTSYAAYLATDPCDNVSGQWHGQWRQQGSRHKCTWDVEANISPLNKKILLEVHLHNPRPILLCQRQDNLTLIGICHQSKISFQMDLVANAFLSGTVAEQSMELKGDIATVNLNRV